MKQILAALGCIFLFSGCGSGSTGTSSSTQAKLLATNNSNPVNYDKVVQQLYVSYFGRPADSAGLSFYDGILASAGAPTTLPEFNAAYANNASIKTIIDGFGTSAESNALYGSDTNTLVNAIYRNLFNRDAEAAGLAFWAGLINKGTYTKAQAALIIMNFAQGSDLASVNNKVTVAKNFTESLMIKTYAYSGLIQNATVRTMLATVNDTTDTTAFQSTESSTIDTLVANTHAVSGTVSGLTADNVVLTNGSESILVSANATAFAFSMTRVANGASYNVTVTPPSPGFSPVCTLTNGTGVMGNADVTNLALSCHARLAVVTTLAGSGSAGGADGNGVAAIFNFPTSVAVDSLGIVYVADYSNNAIRYVYPSGETHTLAGNGVQGNANGTLSAARFHNPQGVALDASGNVYVADYGNNLIRKISTSGTVSTLAGSGSAGFANGTGTAASFDRPARVVVDILGNVYVSDQGNSAIRKITPEGVVTTLAGSGSQGFVNGTGTAASFNTPEGMAVNIFGTIFVADVGNNVIREITSSGVVTTFAGSGAIGSANARGTAATFNFPRGLALDASGNLLVTDTVNHLIRKITYDGVVSTLAGSGSPGSANGTGTGASFNDPTGLAVDSVGNVYIADLNNNMIRKITPQ